MPRSLSVVAFGEWKPDLPTIANDGLILARNVVPLTAHSYTEMESLELFHDALPSAITGQYSLTDARGIGYEWAADSNRLWVKQSVATSWNDATGPSGPYNPAAGSGHWTMTAFGDRIIAANGYDTVQSYLHGTDSAFSDLSPAAPRGRYVAVVRDFVFLANMAQDNLPQRVQWSALGDPTYWPTPGTDNAVQVQSDYQDLQQTDLGPITGIFGGGLGGTDGAVFCAWGIYRISYVGSPVIFSFLPAAGAPGTQAPKSIAIAPVVTERGSAFFAMYLSSDGFYAFDGSSSASIGSQKFDRMFFQMIDMAAIHDVQAVVDPTRKLAMWAFKADGVPGRYNRLLVYNWEFSRATIVDLAETPIEWLTERDGGDRIWRVVAFDLAHRMNGFSGPSLACDVITSDRALFGGRKSLVLSTRPLVDGDPNQGTITLASRDIPTDEIVWDAEVPVDMLGNCPQRSCGRYIRFRLRRPAGTSFRHLQGIEVQAAPAGRRR